VDGNSIRSRFDRLFHRADQGLAIWMDACLGACGEMKDQTHPSSVLESRLDQSLMHHNRICSARGYGTDHLPHMNQPGHRADRDP